MLPVFPNAFVLVVILSAAGAAQVPDGAPQAPPRDARVQPQRGTATIRGRAVAADTGEPLRRVQIRLQPFGPDVRGLRAAMTDDEGRYELIDLPAGRYQLSASKGGYVDVEYGQRRPLENGRPVELGEKQVLDSINFSLPRGAVVSGRVIDEAGEPVARTSVNLAHYRYVNGARQLTTIFGDSTDDRGEFRIFGISPGDYFIVASFDRPDFGSTDRVRYVPTYHPGTSSLVEAQRVPVTLGQEVSGIVIPLARAATATVSGVLRMADGGRPLLSFVIARRSEDAPGFGETETGVAGPDGSFSIGGLLPGTYILEAHAAPGEEKGQTEVAVNNGDVAGVTLVLSKGATSRGRIRFDIGAPPQGDLSASQVFVSVSALDRRLGFSSDGSRRPTVRDDWTFELNGIHGRGVIRAGTATTWQMKHVYLNGVDVTDLPVDFRNGDVDGLDIVLTQQTTDLSGTVKDERGVTVADASVVVFADDREKWGPESRFIGTARPDQQGRFNIRGLPPGRYLAVAVEYLESGEERDPELLEQWRRDATTLTLGEGETRATSVKLSR